MIFLQLVTCWVGRQCELRNPLAKHYRFTPAKEGNTYMKRVLPMLSLLIALFALVGCDQRPAPPPEVNDDVYNSDVSIKGKWQVRYAGRVTIEVDDEGVVNVYGISYSSNNTTVRPDIKVIGNGVTFKVHNADNVKADDGVTLYAYNSNLVKASHQSRIFAYNCDKVLAVHDVAAVEAHGTTRVQRLRGPDPVVPAPAPSATTDGDPTKK